MYEEIFESIRVAAAKRNLKESTAGAYCRTVKYFMEKKPKQQEQEAR